jgi:hypothetical protein
MVMNLAQAMLTGPGLEAFLSEWRAQDTNKKLARQMSTLRKRFMIAQFLNWQSTLLTSKVDGNMPLRGNASI